jgi:beta-glucanase (GH16 family)
VCECAPLQAHGTYHWQSDVPKKNCTYPVDHQEVTVSVKMAEWDTQYHEYAVEHGAGYVAFVYDGVVALNSSSPMFWGVPFYVILNTAVGGGWPGEPTNATVFPTTHSIDYVRVAVHGA